MIGHEILETIRNADITYKLQLHKYNITPAYGAEFDRIGLHKPSICPDV